MASLNPSAGFCLAEITLTSLTPPSGAGKSLQYFIGTTAITSLIPISAGLTTIAQIQALIDADPVYQSSKTTITIISFDAGGLVATIQKASSFKIRDLVIGEYGDGISTETRKSPFICKLKNSAGGGFFFIPTPDEIPVAKSSFPDGVPQTVIFKQTKYYYNREDELNYYYRKTPNPNAQRPLRGWLVAWA